MIITIYNSKPYNIILFYCIGEEYNISFVSCLCEPLVVTMARARLWPSSPQRPHLAFTFELLDWAEALLLECQVALKDFCKALTFKCPHLMQKVTLDVFEIAILFPSISSEKRCVFIFN